MTAVSYVAASERRWILLCQFACTLSTRILFGGGHCFGGSLLGALRPSAAESRLALRAQPRVQLFYGIRETLRIQRLYFVFAVPALLAFWVSTLAARGALWVCARGSTAVFTVDASACFCLILPHALRETL